LPGRNGVDVLKSIHSDRPFIPVVMLTGQGNETVAVTAMREGAQNYISKTTITHDTLHRAVQVGDRALRDGTAHRRTTQLAGNLYARART